MKRRRIKKKRKWEKDRYLKKCKRHLATLATLSIRKNANHKLSAATFLLLELVKIAENYVFPLSLERKRKLSDLLVEKKNSEARSFNLLAS